MKPKFEIEHAKKRAIDSLHADYKKASTLMKSTISLKALRYALKTRKTIWIL